MPVLHDKCVGCHNSQYQYAGLNLLDYADLFREGESGTPVVPGKVESSELFVRATLPQSDEKFMPPDAAGLSYTDLKILEYWIEQGADSSARFDNTTMPAELIELIRRDYNLDYAPRPYYEKVRADSLAAELLETVINSEYSVGYLGEDNFFVSVKFEGDTLTQDHAAALDAIKNNISILDLSGSFIIDSSSLALSKFNNVVRIDLHGTNVTNDVFEDFSALKHLEVLNIYNTGVSDTGLEKILNAPSLRRVYIWKTSVTDEYLDGIRRAYPKTAFVSAFKFENVEVDTVEVE